MKIRIGFFVQGAVDRAFVKGLVDRFCPDAVVEFGRYRNSTSLGLKRELRVACEALLVQKSCSYLVILTDSDSGDWRRVHARESRHIPPNYADRCIFGVADRNIECWLSINQDTLARFLGCQSSELSSPDPSGIVQKLFGFTNRDLTDDQNDEMVSGFLRDAPIQHWRRNSKSFEHFWDQVYELSKRAGCQIDHFR